MGPSSFPLPPPSLRLPRATSVSDLCQRAFPGRADHMHLSAIGGMSLGFEAGFPGVRVENSPPSAQTRGLCVDVWAFSCCLDSALSRRPPRPASVAPEITLGGGPAFCSHPWVGRNISPSVELRKLLDGTCLQQQPWLLCSEDAAWKGRAEGTPGLLKEQESAPSRGTKSDLLVPTATSTCVFLESPRRLQPKAHGWAETEVPARVLAPPFPT